MRPAQCRWVAVAVLSVLVGGGCSDDDSGSADLGVDSAQVVKDGGLPDGAAPDQSMTPDQGEGPDVGPDAGPASAWQLVDVTVNQQLRDIAGSSPNHIFAVGTKGYVLHYSGSTWSTMVTGVEGDLNAVWVSPSGRALAAGADAILSYDPEASSSDAGVEPGWERIYTSSWSAVTFLDVCATTDGAIFAVAERGEERRLLPGDLWWDSDVLDTSEDLNAVICFDEGQAITAGDKGTILTWTPSGWEPLASGTTTNLTDLWGTSMSDVYAVGLDGVVLHYDGYAWTPVETGVQTYFHGVWGSGPADLFAVGESLFGQDEEAVMHYDGTSWRAIPTAHPAPLMAVWGSAPDNVYAVGKHTILHYDGTAP